MSTLNFIIVAWVIGSAYLAGWLLATKSNDDDLKEFREGLRNREPLYIAIMIVCGPLGLFSIALDIRWLIIKVFHILFMVD